SEAHPARSAPEATKMAAAVRPPPPSFAARRSARPACSELVLDGRVTALTVSGCVHWLWRAAIALMGESRMKLFDLSGRSGGITGGNGGIGLGRALGMAQAGAEIVVAGRDAAKSQTAVKQIASVGAKASAIAVDVLKEESCRALIAETMKAHGRLDILVNNA